MNPKVPGRGPTRSTALTIDQALSGSEMLARLSSLLRESKARYAAIRPLLPEALAAHVRPGPLDDEGWSLLAANAAVAAKLRQMKPRLEDALHERGWQRSPIRVKIQSPHGNRL